MGYAEEVKVIEAFIEGQPKKYARTPLYSGKEWVSQSSVIKKLTATLYSYGLHWPICRRFVENGKPIFEFTDSWWVKPYSSTTAGHQALLHEMLSERGLLPDQSMPDSIKTDIAYRINRDIADTAPGKLHDNVKRNTHRFATYDWEAVIALIERNPITQIASTETAEYEPTSLTAYNAWVPKRNAVVAQRITAVIARLRNETPPPCAPMPKEPLLKQSTHRYLRIYADIKDGETKAGYMQRHRHQSLYTAKPFTDEEDSGQTSQHYAKIYDLVEQARNYPEQESDEAKAIMAAVYTIAEQIRTHRNNPLYHGTLDIPVLGWHFLRSTETTLSFGDNRPIIPGETLSVSGEMAVCQKGLHMSLTPADCSRYVSPPTYIERVAISGAFHTNGMDKVCAEHRECFAIFSYEDYEKWCFIEKGQDAPYDADSMLAYLAASQNYSDPTTGYTDPLKESSTDDPVMATPE